MDYYNVRITVEVDGHEGYSTQRVARVTRDDTIHGDHAAGELTPHVVSLADNAVEAAVGQIAAYDHVRAAAEQTGTDGD